MASGGGGGLEEKLLIEGGGDGHSHSHSQRKLRSSLSHIRASRRRQRPSHPPQYKEEEEEEEDGGQVEDNRAPWRKHLGDALESTLAHLTILSLLLIDLLATAIDILKTLHNSSTDLSSCLALLHSCPCPSSPDSPPFERAREWSFLFWISIVILSVLAFNILALLVAFGTAFFNDPGYVLDLVVIFTALSLEIFLDSETASLLVILNLWRIVRVAHGIFEVTDDALEEEVRALKSRAKAAAFARSEDARLLREKDKRIAELESRLQMHIEKSPSFSTYIHS